jgi:hypothetical protein
VGLRRGRQQQRHCKTWKRVRRNSYNKGKEHVWAMMAAFVCATAHQSAERCTKEMLATVAMPCPGVEDVLGRGCSPALLAEQRGPRRMRQGLTLKKWSGPRQRRGTVGCLWRTVGAALRRRVRKRAGRPCSMSDELATEGHQSGRTPDGPGPAIKGTPKLGRCKRPFGTRAPGCRCAGA